MKLSLLSQFTKPNKDPQVTKNAPKPKAMGRPSDDHPLPAPWTTDHNQVIAHQETNIPI